MEEAKDQNSYPQMVRQSTELDYFKFVIIGPQQCGKSSIIQNIFDKPFNPDIRPTSCYEIHIKNFEVRERMHEVRLWDCSVYHKDSYSTVKKAFYRSTHTAFIVVDISQFSGIEQQVDEWVDECIANDIQSVIVFANKKDILEEAPIQSKLGSPNQQYPLIDGTPQSSKVEGGNAIKEQELIQRMAKKGIQMFIGSCKSDGQFKAIFLKLFEQMVNNIFQSGSRFDSDRNLLVTTYQARQENNQSKIVAILVPQTVIREKQARKCVIF